MTSRFFGDYYYTIDLYCKGSKWRFCYIYYIFVDRGKVEFNLASMSN